MKNKKIMSEMLEYKYYDAEIAVNFFDSLNIHRVGIFGCGEIGALVYKELKNIGLEIVCFIDNSFKGNIFGTKVIKPNELEGRNDIDAIIIALSLRVEIFYISKQLSEHFKDVIIDISTFLTVCRVMNYAKLYKKLSDDLSLNVVCLQLYSICNLEEISRLEMLSVGRHFSDITHKGEMFEISKDLMEEYIDKNEYIKALVSPKPDTIIIDDLITNVDFRSICVNVIGSKRYTTDVPEKYSHTVHLFGSSTTYGAGVEDKYTIASILQRKLNTIKTKTCRVISHAIRGVYAFSEMSYNNILNNKSINFGDTVVFVMDAYSLYISNNKQARIKIDKYLKSYFEEICFNYCSSFEAFNENHLHDNLFLDNNHLSAKGNCCVAELIYPFIEKNNNRNIRDSIDCDSINVNKYLKLDNIEDYDSIISYVEKVKSNNAFGKIGSIVVNCNPFTNGHRYLIEKSYENVDFLYIFVVQEDKSYFPFSERIALVNEGVKDIHNCVVVPSGRFIISTKTFPEYFQKDTLLSTCIDCSSDINIFAKYIAPTLGIKVRFVGDEPFCNVTQQYNDAMARILPEHGIEIKVIKRLEYEDNPVSASGIRQLLKKGDLDKIKWLVPKTTYDYLKKMKL